MKFVPYVKFESNDDSYLFRMDSDLPSSLARQKEDFFGLLPTASAEWQAADLRKLTSKCCEIVEILESRDEGDGFGYASPYVELLELLEESTQAKMIFRTEPQTLCQLVDCAGEGGLEDEWTKQFISRNSELYLSSLKELLEDPRNSENYFAIIRLLLLCFPRDQVAPSVEAFMQQTEDMDLKEQAMFLLMVFDN